MVKYILCSKSRYKPKLTDCFNDPGFIQLFSQQLRLDAEQLDLNKANSRANPSLSQGGLATLLVTFINLPETVAASGSPAVGEGNIVLHGATMQESCENASPQTPSQAPIQATTLAQNTTPTRRANRGKNNEFYVVTRGRCTGVFDSW